MRKLLLFILLASPVFAQGNFLNLDESPWSTCGACGNSGGTGTIAGHSNAIQPFSRDGAAVQFAIVPSGSYQNIYWYQKRAIDCTTTQSTTEFDIYIPSAAASVAQFEFGNYQQCSKFNYNGAWQANRTLKVWRVFNLGAHRWDATTIPLNLAPDTWHHIKATYHRDLVAHVGYRDSLVIDGTIYPVALKYPAVAVTSTTNFLSDAFQLDGDKAGDAFSVFVDKYTLSAW